MSFLSLGSPWVTIRTFSHRGLLGRSWVLVKRAWSLSADPAAWGAPESFGLQRGWTSRGLRLRLQGMPASWAGSLRAASFSLRGSEPLS